MFKYIEVEAVIKLHDIWEPSEMDASLLENMKHGMLTFIQKKGDIKFLEN